MSDEAAVDQLVGRYDADTETHELTGWTSGPAGVASLTLGRGALVVDFDYVSPGTISRIETVEPGRTWSDTAADALEALTWIEGLHRQLESVDDRPQIVWAREEMSSLPGMGEAAEMGRLAVLLAERDNPRRSLRARAASALEAANIAATADKRLGLEVDVSGLWREAVESLGIVSEDAVVEQLEIAEERCADIEPGLARIFARLRATQIEMVRSAAAPARPFAAAALSGSAPPPRIGRSIDIVVDPLLDCRSTRVSLIDGVVDSDIDFAASAHEATYLKVFKRGKHAIPLAVVPLTPDRGTYRAMCVVPQHLTDEELVAEVSFDPAATMPTPLVHNVTRAVRLGQDARRQELRGDERTARNGWRECAAQWRELEDVRRANLAEAYSRGERTRAQRGSWRDDEPLASDSME